MRSLGLWVEGRRIAIEPSAVRPPVLDEVGSPWLVLHQDVHYRPFFRLYDLRLISIIDGSESYPNRLSRIYVVPIRRDDDPKVITPARTLIYLKWLQLTCFFFGCSRRPYLSRINRLSWHMHPRDLFCFGWSWLATDE